MIGNDLIVAIPWMAFGLSLAAVCLRLCRFPRFPGRSRDGEPRQPAGDRHESSANTSEPTGNDDQRPAVSSPAQSSQTRSWQTQPSQTRSWQAQPSQTRSWQTQPSQTQPSQTRSWQAQPSQTQPSETQPSETQP